ncbi:MAG: insulinase family protein [Verrucomicrobiota bacterium]
MTAKPVVYLMDRPNSIQSMICRRGAPPKSDPDDIAIETMNQVLGGSFTSRINMNLREDKHWSYGAGTVVYNALGQRPFIAYAPVQTDKTKESVSELEKELKEVASTRAVTDQELDKVKKQMTLELAGRWQTMSSVESDIRDIVRYHLPDDYYQTYPAKVRALDLEKVAAAARKVVHPDRLVWVVVGDRSKVEDGLRQLGFGDFKLIDTDGKVLD